MGGWIQAILKCQVDGRRVRRPGAWVGTVLVLLLVLVWSGFGRRDVLVPCPSSSTSEPGTTPDGVCKDPVSFAIPRSHVMLFLLLSLSHQKISFGLNLPLIQKFLTNCYFDTEFLLLSVFHINERFLKIYLQMSAFWDFHLFEHLEPFECMYVHCALVHGASSKATNRWLQLCTSGGRRLSQTWGCYKEPLHHAASISDFHKKIGDMIRVWPNEKG